MSGERGPVDGLLVAVDPGTGRPLHQQLERELRSAIRSGRLGPGTALPSTRRLSSQLGVSRGVVTAAYSQLAAEGYLVMRQGAPVRVGDAVRGGAPRPSARMLARTFSYDLRPLPDPATFPRVGWQRALREALRAAPVARLADIDPRGTPELRDALAAYLDRVRGTNVDPELMVVTNGFSQAFSIACRCLAEQGLEAIAIEEPGWHQHRLIAEQAALRVVPVPVDGAGLDISELAASEAEAVVVTPAHQFPTGAVLAAERRARLLEWAERHDRLVVEDDYDTELRFSGVTVGALQGLAPERVLYIGSAGKRLAPGLRLGWMTAPSWLSWPLVSAKAVEDLGTDVLAQLALAEFIARGQLDRHLRRMRLLHARRRATLLDTLRASAPGLSGTDDPAGLAELLLLPASVDEAAVLAAAARRGVGLDGLAQHCAVPGGRGGLLFGYGAAPEPALRRACELVAEAVDEAGASGPGSPP